VNTTSEEAWFCLDSTNTEATISSLLSQGIQTYVLGMGNSSESNPTVMNAMAVKGGTGHYYPASTPTGLVTALQQILPHFGCNYAIDGTPVNPKLLSVSYKGVPLVAGSPNGYLYTAPSTITLLGTTCMEVQSGGNLGDVDITAIANP
jgi:hypothetical protein